MALGAFLAGMMLAETEYSHQVESVIRPFRDILLGLFFISVGMLLDFDALWRELWLILALLVADGARQGGDRLVRHAPVRRFQFQGDAHRRHAGRRWRVRHRVAHAAAAEQGHRSRRRAATAGRRGDGHGAGAGHPREQQARRAAVVRRARPAARPPSSARTRPRRRWPSASTSSSAASAASVRTWRACSRRRASNTSPSTSTRCACAPRGRSASPVVYGDSADEQVLEEVGLSNANAVVISFSEHAHLARHPAQSCAACAPTCRCWCARPTTRGCSSSRPPAPPRWCPRPSKPASCWPRTC